MRMARGHRPATIHARSTADLANEVCNLLLQFFRIEPGVYRSNLWILAIQLFVPVKGIDRRTHQLPDAFSPPKPFVQRGLRGSVLWILPGGSPRHCIQVIVDASFSRNQSTNAQELSPVEPKISGIGRKDAGAPNQLRFGEMFRPPRSPVVAVVAKIIPPCSFEFCASAVAKQEGRSDLDRSHTVTVDPKGSQRARPELPFEVGAIYGAVHGQLHEHAIRRLSHAAATSHPNPDRSDNRQPRR